MKVRIKSKFNDNVKNNEYIIITQFLNIKDTHEMCNLLPSFYLCFEIVPDQTTDASICQYMSECLVIGDTESARVCYELR